MKRRARWILPALLLLGAARLAADPLPTWGLSLGGGYNSYALDDLNQGRADAIHAGPGLDLGLWWRGLPWLALNLSGEYLMPAERDSPGQFTYYNPLSGSYQPWDYTVRERYDALEGLLQAFVVWPLGGFSLRLGGGGGLACLAGATVSSDAPGSQERLLYGSGASWRAAVGLDWQVDPHFGLSLEAGRRWCVIQRIDQAGGASDPMKNAQGGCLGVDYGGWSSRVCGVFWF